MQVHKLAETWHLQAVVAGRLLAYDQPRRRVARARAARPERVLQGGHKAQAGEAPRGGERVEVPLNVQVAHATEGRARR